MKERSLIRIAVAGAVRQPPSWRCVSGIAALFLVSTVAFSQPSRPGTGKALKAHGSVVLAIGVSPEGTFAASIGSDLVRLWSLPELTAVRSWDKFPAPVAVAAFSPDFKLLATAMEDGSIQLWAIPGGERIASWPSRGPGERVARITALSFTSDGSSLLSGNDDGVASVWSLPAGKPLHSLRHDDGAVHSLAWAKSEGRGQLVLTAAGTGRDINIWSLPDGRKLPPLRGHTRYIQNLMTTPDGEWLISSSNTEIKAWALRDGRAASNREDPKEDGVERSRGDAGAISRDGRWLASIEVISRREQDRRSGRTNLVEKHYVSIRQLPASGLLTRLEHPVRVKSLAFSPDGGVLITGDHSGVIHRWDLAKMGVRPQ